MILKTVTVNPVTGIGCGQVGPIKSVAVFKVKLVAYSCAALTPYAPAKLIKEFAKKNDKVRYKAAYVEESFYDETQLEALVAVKSKNELIADVIAMLESPVQGVISALESGANTIHGVLETLEKK